MTGRQKSASLARMTFPYPPPLPDYCVTLKNLDLSFTARLSCLLTAKELKGLGFEKASMIKDLLGQETICSLWHLMGHNYLLLMGKSRYFAHPLDNRSTETDYPQPAFV